MAKRRVKIHKKVLFMHIFYRPMYYSEATKFIDQLKVTNPQMSAGQLDGRAQMWKKSVDAATSDEFQAARVKQKPYVYQTNIDQA